jgi:tetratricopeptide (TPR) repeat protein
MIQKDDWPAASVTAASILEKEPSNLRALHLQARCFMKEHRINDALKLYEQAEQISPSHIDRLIDFGHALLQADRTKEAIKKFDSALKLDQSNKKAKQGSGEAQLLAGDINAALTLLRGTSNQTELAAIFNSAAIIAIRSDRFSQGLELYKSAIATLAENNVIASKLLFNMGIAHYKSGDTSLALGCFQEAVKINPAHKLAGDNIKILHNKAIAVKDRLKAISGGGKDTRIPTAMDVITELQDDIEDETLY